MQIQIVVFDVPLPNMKTIYGYMERFQATSVTVDSQWCEEDACQGKSGRNWHRIV